MHLCCDFVSTVDGRETTFKPHLCCVQDAERVLVAEVKSRGKMDSLQPVRAELLHLGLARMLVGSLYISCAAVPGMCFDDLTDSDFTSSTDFKSGQSAASTCMSCIVYAMSCKSC